MCVLQQTLSYNLHINEVEIKISGSTIYSETICIFFLKNHVFFVIIVKAWDVQRRQDCQALRSSKCLLINVFVPCSSLFLDNFSRGPFNGHNIFSHQVLRSISPPSELWLEEMVCRFQSIPWEDFVAFVLAALGAWPSHE